MRRIALSVILSILSFLALTCGNPLDQRSNEGKLQVTCVVEDPGTAKPASEIVRADLIVLNTSGAPVAKAALIFSGKSASGSVEVKAGTGYRVEVYGYDSFNSITYYGFSSDITVEAEKNTATFIGLMGFIGKPRCILSCRITGADSVTVTLSGDKTATRMLNNERSYFFTVVYGGNYTVTPTKTGYVFTPASRTFTNVTADQGLNFTAQAIVVPDVKMISIPSGTFQMGDIDFDLPGQPEEKPVHTVTLSGFEMSAFEITNVQYAQFLNNALNNGDIRVTNEDVIGAKGAYLEQYIHYTGTNFTGYPDVRCWIEYSNNVFSVFPGHENWPVTWVTWYGAKAFALDNDYDLPTEAEWEYACRGGKQYKYGTNDGTISPSNANVLESNINHPVNVGSYLPNPFGLYDMSGNVREWCHDFYGTYPSISVVNPSGPQTGEFRLIRGGCYYHDAWSSGSAVRGATGAPSTRDYTLGFRVVRRVSPQNY